MQQSEIRIKENKQYVEIEIKKETRYNFELNKTSQKSTKKKKNKIYRS